jgi:hypothetical protein
VFTLLLVPALFSLTLDARSALGRVFRREVTPNPAGS